MANSKDQILDAALIVVERDGVSAMTLDSVCRQASISKGGLLYHFPNKDALMAAMVERFVGQFEQMVLAIEAQEPHSKHRRIRTMLRMGLALSDPNASPQLPYSPLHGAELPRSGLKLMISLLTVSANNPELLTSIRQQFQRLRDVMMNDSGDDGILALILWMAFDGMMLWQHLGLLTPEDPIREQALQKMLQLVSESDPLAIDAPSTKRSRKGAE